MPACEDDGVQLVVRDRWEHEALNFTPWLAKKLHLLGDSLGLKLEWIQSEVPIGPYFLDILARETREDVKVAIENQLEETDLHHLGQLLTYATGCGAHIAIWVAPEFGYEHAQALHLLNEWTNGRIRFYGVKVEIIKKAGVVRPEPRFREVVYPGGWNKKITLKSREMPPTTRRYNELFQPIVTELLEKDFADKAVYHFGPSGRRFPSRLDPAVRYAVSLQGRNDAWVTLNIRTQDIERTNEIFGKLQDHREQIEKCLAAEWHWRRFEKHKFSSISIRRDGSIDDPPERLQETRDWMLVHLPKLKEIFDPLLKKILASK